MLRPSSAAFESNAYAQGLWDAQKNIRALRSTGGNVEAAIELIFSGQMDGPGN